MPASATNILQAVFCDTNAACNILSRVAVQNSVTRGVRRPNTPLVDDRRVTQRQPPMSTALPSSRRSTSSNAGQNILMYKRSRYAESMIFKTSSYYAVARTDLQGFDRSAISIAEMPRTKILPRYNFLPAAGLARSPLTADSTVETPAAIRAFSSAVRRRRPRYPRPGDASRMALNPAFAIAPSPTVSSCQAVW
jgi:hypothetical protein